MSRKVYVGDFILSNSMSFGRPYILNIDGCIHDGWLVIQDYQETFDKDFLYYTLGSDDVFKQYISMAAGSSVKNLNKDKVANVVLSVPNTKSEQQAIASVLSSMDNEIAALEAKRKKYEAVKQGMMQQLLTGKIRLI
jgi:type I restriction enzyme S subunit